MARRISFTTLCITIGFLAGMVLTGRFRIAEESSAAEQTAAAAPASGQAAAARPAVAAPAAVLPDLTSVAQRVVGSVTNISSTQIVRGSSSPFENDPFFRYFFGDDDPFGNRERRAQSLGSGVIVSADGYLLTNNHVVGDAERRRCRWCSATSASCRPRSSASTSGPTSRCSRSTRRNLPVLPWGDSSKLKVAEWVLAIGNPFQLNQTVTLGIVSAHRPQPRRAPGDLRGLHPDRRRDQPGQLRRRADQRPRRADRHQHGDLQRVRRLPGHRLRRAEQPRAARHGRSDQVRRGPPRHDPGHQAPADDDRRSPEQLGAPNARGALVYSRRSALRRLSRRPPPRRHHRRLQRLARSRTPRSSSACCPTRRSARP